MFLNVNNISKQYENKPVLKNVSFSLDAHTTLSILGKSGCGKTTLLRIISGIEVQDSGTIEFENVNISGIPPNKRNIVYLFQESLLFPHLDAFENIAFGLRIRKVRESEIKTMVHNLLESLEITEQSHKMPGQLSGGQKQRVAFGRALIINPRLILLDEPFSSLDVETRHTMQQLYKKIAARFNITALFVTHDLKEALIMGDKTGFMESGNLEVFDSKEALINDPRTGLRNEINFWNNL